MQGWIKLHRQLIDWEYFQSPNTLQLYIALLLNVSDKDTKYKGVAVPKGGIATSVSKLCMLTGQTAQQVRTSLKHLKDSNTVTVTSTNKFTVITVVNYSIYQSNKGDKQQANNKQVTNKQQTSNNQITNNQQTNNEPSEKEIRNKNKEIRKESVYVTPTLEEVQQYINLKGYTYDALKFYNYYQSIKWKGVSDWKARCDYWNSTEREKSNKSDNTSIKKNVFTDYKQKVYSEEEIQEILNKKRDT